ncbi:LPS export ABC transporter periplasmic protein LptC [Pelagibacterales bacterium SAG-MED46]|nr:LPS export ABC transporter periplasmic protein LptC [Pelagibacterales bacterium SAG-MED46]
MKKKNLIIYTIIFISIISFISYIKYSKESPKKIEAEIKEAEDNIYSSNIITEVSFESKDPKGNTYKISALEGEIDFSDNKIIFLKRIDASIELDNLTKIIIKSNFGKYNTENFNTIFSENVIINYLDNKISAEYVDFSIEGNLMTISKNVVYSNLKSTLKADVVEINIITKDVKIYMHEELKKVKIKSKN